MFHDPSINYRKKKIEQIPPQNKQTHLLRRGLKRVYIVGSHSTGKTHLARSISTIYRLPLVTEVARAVLAEREIPLDLLRVDPTRTAEYQNAVFEGQLKAEIATGPCFVSDRAFDCIAYACSHTLSSSTFSDRAFEYAKRLRADDCVVFFTRPHPELTVADGVREAPSWDEMVRIDAMVKMLLEWHDVDYTVISTLSMSERIRTVRSVLGRP